MDRRVVVTDANIIINFLHIERLDILGSLPGLRFVVPDHVIEEITREEQAVALARVIDEGLVDRLDMTDLDEIETWAALLARLGSGEAACLAIAIVAANRFVLPFDALEGLAYRRPRGLAG